MAQNFSISGDFPSVPNVDTIKNTVVDKAKDVASAAGGVQNKIDGNPIAKKVEETIKDVAMDEAHKKAADKLDSADKIINNPLTKMVAGMMGSDINNAVNKAGDHIKKDQANPDIVGNHTKSLI